MSAAASGKAASAAYPYGVVMLSEHAVWSVLLKRCQQPLSKGLSDLALVLHAPSTEGEGTVIWNVIRTYKRSGIYVIQKAVGTGST